MKRFHARGAGLLALAAVTAISFAVINGGPRAAASGKTKVTYAAHVARILQDNCQSCHHPGTAAPFSLLTYDDAVKWAETIKEAVTEKRMPPWYADPRYGKFANDRRLKPADKEA